MAKTFSYFVQQDNGLQMLKRYLKEASDYGIKHLLHSGHDLLPSSVLLDCCWGGNHFFRDSQCINYNELIAYWILEGYLGHINCMEEAYERGHHILMELIDCQILRKVEDGYLIMEMLKLDSIVMERATVNVDNFYRRGFCGTARLGLAIVFGDGKWEGLGRATQKDGIIETQRSGKQGRKFSTYSLLEGDSLCGEFSSNFFQSHQELQILVIFNPLLDILSLSKYMRPNISVLGLRGCHFLEKIESIDHKQSFQNLTVLEISGSSSLTTIPADFFNHMPQLFSLNLSATQIVLLPSSLYELCELSWLILRECSQLESLNSLKNLMVLDLSDATSFRYIKDKTFSRNPELQMLNFSRTKIRSLPLVHSLRKLTHLLLSGCLKLDRLCGINSVTSLQVDLSDASNFKEFHDQTLESIEGLQILDLSGTAVDHLPSDMGKPRHLHLKGCTRLENLSCVEKLVELVVLDLSKAQFKTPPSLSHLCNLLWLSLSWCSKLEKLPDLNSLHKLEVLDLSGCIALKELPCKFFEQMSCLKKLDLSETKIRRLPSLSNLTKLCHLLLKNCRGLEVLPPLESLFELEELNLCGISLLRETGADFLKSMSHLLILDFSETHLEQLPSLSDLKNLRELYLRGCARLKSVPGLDKLTKFEVLDLSGTAMAVDDLLPLKNFVNLSKLLLRDCPHPILSLLGAIKNNEGTSSSKVEDPNHYGWGISILPHEIPCGSGKPPVSLSSSKFLQLLRDNMSSWKTSFNQFYFSVYRIEEQHRKGVVSFFGDNFKLTDVYFQTRQFSNFKEQWSLEISGFHHPPKGIVDLLHHADCVFFIVNAVERWLSDLGASNLNSLKGCWMERCREMQCVFYEEEAEEKVKLECLEILYVSNSVNLKSISSGKWRSDTFGNLKRLYLDCCPKLKVVFSSSQKPINLRVLQIKFCDELEAVFEEESPEPQLLHLETLHLWELPKLERVGCSLPSLKLPKVLGCPKLLDFKDNVIFSRRS